MDGAVRLILIHPYPPSQLKVAVFTGMWDLTRLEKSPAGTQLLSSLLLKVISVVFKVENGLRDLALILLPTGMFAC